MLVRNLYLLSDGIKREFGLEGLQAIRDSNCRNTLIDMDLSGCFRVSTNVMRSIALFPNLRRLTDREQKKSVFQ